MKTLKLLFALLIIAAIATSCEKEEGPAGPAGAAGTNGTNGTNGNANVSVYGFGQQLFNAGNIYLNGFSFSGMTNEEIDSSLFIPYYFADGYFNWYTAGQVGPVNQYQSRCFIITTSPTQPLKIVLCDPDGTSYTGADVTWDSVRIFVIPANTFRLANKQNVDFNNYNEVSAYFNAR